MPQLLWRESRSSPRERAWQGPFLQRRVSCAGTAFKADVPYAVLLVELDEGPRMISTYTGGGPDEVTFDMEVRLICEKVTDEVTLPRFTRA